MATVKQNIAVFNAVNSAAIDLLKRLVPQFAPGFMDADIERKAMTQLAAHPEWVSEISAAAIKAYEANYDGVLE